MPRLESMKVAIRTGKIGTESPVLLNFNGFIVPLDQPEGRTMPSELYAGTFSPNSVPHVLTLSGPEQGAWEIEQVTVEYTLEGETPYTVSFGSADQPIKLDETNQLHIWAERPLPTFDV
jgi:hypothetical protein